MAFTPDNKFNLRREIIQNIRNVTSSEDVHKIMDVIQETLLEEIMEWKNGGETSIADAITSYIDFNNKNITDKKFKDISTDGYDVELFKYMLDNGAIPPDDFLYEILIKAVIDIEDSREILKIYLNMFPDSGLIIPKDGFIVQIEQNIDDSADIDDLINKFNEFISQLGYELRQKDLRTYVFEKKRTLKRGLETGVTGGATRRRVVSPPRNMQF